MHSVNTAPGGSGEGRCLNVMSWCVCIPRDLTRVDCFRKRAPVSVIALFIAKCDKLIPFFHFRNSSNHTCPFLQQQRHQQHHHSSHNRLFHPSTNSNFCPLSMASTVPLQHHPPHPGPPVIIDVDQIPDHVRAVPVTSLPNSLLVASVPVAAPTYIQPHQPPVS